MKKNIMKILFLFCLILFSENIYAATYQVTLTGNSVALRKDAGKEFEKIAALSEGASYFTNTNEIFPDSAQKGCSAGWYKINYSKDVTGFICSSYATIKEIDENIINNCKQDLINKGFPESYVSDLCLLKQIHNNWTFEPLITNLDWDYSVEKESECGKSYVYTTSPENIDSSCKNMYEGKVEGLYPASKKIVAYYMDPRNFLTEKYIFQFEALSYSNLLENDYPIGITTILNDAKFFVYHNDLGNEFAKTLNSAAKNANVNAIFLASRILQELGRTDKLYNLYSGIYEGEYYGHYNFFNYGVSDACATTNGVTYCGLSYAKSQGWNSLYNALYGGASKMASNYIAQNQNTNYLQKFNVTPLDSNKLFIHQYMTNIGAPSSESSSSFKTYSSNNLLSSPFVFYIPVYKNMDTTINNSGSGAVEDNTQNQVVSVPISSIVTSAGFKYTSNYISGITVGANITDLKNTISSVGATVQVLNHNNENIESGVMATGYKVVISNSSNKEELTVVIKGDTSGDGIINALDLLQVQKNILGTYTLAGANSLAADTSSDGTINALDLLQVQKNILGTFTISQ